MPLAQAYGLSQGHSKRFKASRHERRNFSSSILYLEFLGGIEDVLYGIITAGYAGCFGLSLAFYLGGEQPFVGPFLFLAVPLVALLY